MNNIEKIGLVGELSERASNLLDDGVVFVTQAWKLLMVKLIEKRSGWPTSIPESDLNAFDVNKRFLREYAASYKPETESALEPEPGAMDQDNQPPKWDFLVEYLGTIFDNDLENLKKTHAFSDALEKWRGYQVNL